MSNRREHPVGDGEEPRPDRHESEHHTALLIDFDNVTMGIRSNLGQEFRKLLNSDVIRGNVAVQRAYADWRRYPQYIVPLSEASIDLIFAPAYGSSKKNATDIRLAIDALELVFTRPEIRTFILMSGDSDFSSLVLKLKEYGKFVIGVGIQESSSDLLVQNCDEYYSYSALAGLTKAGEHPAERHDPWVLAEKAIQKMVQRNDTMRSDRLKQVMLEIDPSFNEKEHGFTKFNRFVVEAASRGLLSIQKMDAGQYAVAPGDRVGKAEAGAERPRSEQKAGRRSGGRRGRSKAKRPETRGSEADGGRTTSRARPHLTMESAIELLNRALDQLLEGPDDSVRDSDVKRRMLELDEEFDEGELGFNKFSKFLQEADTSGLIELSKGPSGNYHVARPPEGKPRRKKSRGARKKSEADERAEDRGEEAKEVGPSEVSADGSVKAKGRTPEARETEEEREQRRERESKVKRLARRLFGSQKGEPGEEGEARGPGGTREESAGKASRVEETPAEGGTGTKPATASAESPEAKRESGRSDRGRRRAGGDRTSRGQQEAAAHRSGSPTGRSSGTDVGHERSAEPRESVTAGRAVGTEPEGRAEEQKASGKQETSEEPKSSVEQRSSGAQRESESEDRGTASSAQVALPDAPRGTIRGRWGTRGRYRPPDTPPPILEGQTSPRARKVKESSGSGPGTEEGRVESESSSTLESKGLPTDPDQIISYLRSRYAGVGERTAESLVEAFGSDVFRVLEEEPDRIRSILPDHRADRVIEAWREDLERARE